MPLGESLASRDHERLFHPAVAWVVFARPWCVLKDAPYEFVAGTEDRSGDRTDRERMTKIEPGHCQKNLKNSQKARTPRMPRISTGYWGSFLTRESATVSKNRRIYRGRERSVRGPFSTFSISDLNVERALGGSWPLEPPRSNRVIIVGRAEGGGRRNAR